jgi:DNA-directed RNA polymerase specialized sigma24 family protein
VKATPGTLQEGGASFATTHWSVVAQSALTDIPEAASALAQLCEMYWPPIYSFVRRRGYSPSDAQDLTQSFFAFFLRTKAYARTDRLHGKFRSFLLVSVKNFLSDNWDRDQAIRRGGGYQFISLDPETAEAFYDASSASDSTAEHLFELRWAKSLTSGALDSLRQELQTEGKLKLFEQLKNFLTGGASFHRTMKRRRAWIFRERQSRRTSIGCGSVIARLCAARLRAPFRRRTRSTKGCVIFATF